MTILSGARAVYAVYPLPSRRSSSPPKPTSGARPTPTAVVMLGTPFP